MGIVCGLFGVVCLVVFCLLCFVVLVFFLGGECCSEVFVCFGNSPGIL